MQIKCPKCGSDEIILKSSYYTNRDGEKIGKRNGKKGN